MNISKISLGTAQLGFDYGITNINGQPNFKKSIEILNYAWNKGINTFDTAPTYGTSEEIIGSFVSSKKEEDIKNLKIISKLPIIKLKENLTFDNLFKHIKIEINRSLKKLKIEKLPFYLLHHPPDLLYNNGLIVDCLSKLKDDGIIGEFGISAYNPSEIEASLNFKEIKVIQVPINIWDQRLIRNGLLKRLKKNGYTIFSRSIYLQGLFFIQPKNLPDNLKIAKEYLIKLRNLSKEYNLDIDKLAFLFVRDISEITSMVIGAEKIEQVMRNLKLLEEKPLSNQIRQIILKEFSELPDKVINPSYWNKLN